MNLLKKITRIFKTPPPAQEPDFFFPGLVSAKQFAAFKPDQRMQAVMIVGDTSDIKFYQFMKWCVEHDPDLHVRFAALKRLPNFPGDADLLAFLTRLDKLVTKSELEPYLSMALFRTGIITEDDLKARVNGA